MQEITSVSNEVVKSVKRLHRRAIRRETGLFVAEGPHLVQEAMQAGYCMQGLFVHKDYRHELVESAAAAALNTYMVADAPFFAMAQTKTPQGILATVKGGAVGYDGQALRGKLAVALDGVQDPGNVGTILRTAAAVGVGDVLLGPGCADPFCDKALRASMGGVFKLRAYECADLADAVHKAGAAGWHSACAQMAGENFFSADWAQKNTLLVIGSEGAGVSPGVAEACAAAYCLPMEPGNESLNAAVAAGIMLYHLWRVGA